MERAAGDSFQLSLDKTSICSPMSKTLFRRTNTNVIASIGTSIDVRCLRLETQVRQDAPLRCTQQYAAMLRMQLWAGGPAESVKQRQEQRTRHSSVVSLIAELTVQFQWDPSGHKIPDRLSGPERRIVLKADIGGVSRAGLIVILQLMVAIGLGVDSSSILDEHNRSDGVFCNSSPY